MPGVVSDGAEDGGHVFLLQQAQLLQSVDAHPRVREATHTFPHLGMKSQMFITPHQLMMT